ncbi:MAG TPA: glycosyl hydrolase [Candidatus Nanopelagicales bacterium]|nr:glycosyl hydrolase [Candidatus Nanopelagicales bacterium]
MRWMAVPVAVGLLALPTAASAKTVSPEQFGLHVQALGGGVAPQISVSAVRLWDSGVRWDQIETKKGAYDWAALDRAVGAAERAGATEILYVLGSTPKWAASRFSSVDLYGPGTASLPKKSSYYLKYAKAVAKRYKGRITSYQIWNEANTRSFYNGGKYDGWIKLAKLTKDASKAIRKIDKRADIVAASSTVIPTPKFQTESFFFRYLREIKRQKAKVDAISVHLYPVNPKQGPDSRVASIAAVRKVMRKVGLNKPLWDTEVNYGDRRNPAAQVVPKPKKAAGYVSRTYLDSARYDIARTFWYGWDINVLGITMSNPDGSPTRAGQAFLTTREWMTAGSWKGCKDSRGVTTCRVGATKIVYASKSTSLKRPAGVTTVTTLTGASKAADTTIKVGTSPIRLS